MKKIIIIILILFCVIFVIYTENNIIFDITPYFNFYYISNSNDYYILKESRDIVKGLYGATFGLSLGVLAELKYNFVSFYIQGYTETKMNKVEDFYFDPYNQYYDIEFGLDIKNIVLYFEHMCYHPVYVGTGDCDITRENGYYNRFGIKYGSLK